jgi:hypothetical protein
MDKKILVEKDVQEGKTLIEALDASKLNVVGALWFYYSNVGVWRLLIVTPLVEISGPKKCYQVIQSVIADMPHGFGISLESVSVLSPRDRLIQLMKVAIRTGSGINTMRFTAGTINGVFIEDSLIYRLT